MAFPPGSYRLELYRQQFFFPTVIDLVQAGNFTVLQGVAEPLAVPNLSIYGLIFLGSLLVSFGGFNVTRSRFN